MRALFVPDGCGPLAVLSFLKCFNCQRNFSLEEFFCVVLSRKADCDVNFYCALDMISNKSIGGMLGHVGCGQWILVGWGSGVGCAICCYDCDYGG